MVVKRVLVTGASGFVGNHIVMRLLDAGVQVFSFTRKPQAEMMSHKVTSASVDYLDEPLLTRKLAEIKPDCIVHLSSSRDRTSFANCQLINFYDDVAADVNLIMASSKLTELKSFIFFGTADIYSDDGVLNSKSPVLPKNPYGLRKSMGISLLSSLARSQGFPALCLIPSVIYGPAQQTDMFLPALIDSLLKNQKFSMTDGSQMRDYIYVRDIVDVVLNHINGPNLACVGRTILLGSGEAISIKKLAQMVEPLIGVNKDSLLDIGGIGQRSRESKGYSYDMNESFELLNWKPKFSLHDGLIETIDYAKNVTHA
jgi:UDP-glucose 4-epimerase